MLFRGQCHCGAVRDELTTDRPPGGQGVGPCECSMCGKHNGWACSDPKARVTLTAVVLLHVGLYAFGLKTSHQVICRQCGVYVAMTLADADEVWCVLNVDT